jgi:hypothetical protein
MASVTGFHRGNPGVTVFVDLSMTESAIEPQLVHMKFVREGDRLFHEVALSGEVT